MPCHRLTYRGVDRYPGRDAYGVSLGWERDGDPLGIAEAVVTGQDLLGLSAPPDDRFWAAAAVCVADAVADHVEHGEGRGTWEQSAFRVQINPAQAGALIATGQAPDGFQRGDLVKEFRADG